MIYQKLRRAFCNTVADAIIIGLEINDNERVCQMKKGMPVGKSSSVRTIDTSEVSRMTPQNPHISPLDVNVKRIL
ncbi:hypothetical protein L3X38_009979 [Prunus dulcis]|uniref:Uncharacterized protein n=1 Tax=Prunus dulcis TaxID=3755 RepID=A0AAD4WEW8_PRUDU|nr:hypothetical protein L3X38_009979 [Prunus dulcis]